MSYSKELSRLALELRRVRRELRALPGELEQRERQILDDGDLTTEARRIELRKVRDEERARQQKLHKRLLTAEAEAKQLEKKIRALRPIEDTARVRVRGLLDRGLAYDQIIDQAVALGDDETVAALRWEAMYHGDKSGFKDASDTVRACDRALAQIGSGGERDNNRAILSVEDASRGIREVSEFAAKAVVGKATPHDRLRLAYAVGPEDGDDA